MNKKECFKCKLTKELLEFYKHSRMEDGHLNKCKECTKKDVAVTRYKNHDYYLEYDRARSLLAHRKERQKEYQKIYRPNNRQKVRARTMVRNAVTSGELKKLPCLVCGTFLRVESHHEDYNKPLEVVWLCSMHHKHVHFGKIKLQRNDSGYEAA